MRTRYLPQGIAGLILLLGLAEFSYGLWIPAKAWLSQVLLTRAWAQTQYQSGVHKPWPWADTWPVMRLSHRQSSTDFIVLANDSGQSLAFGPGHLSSSYLPGQGGNIVISGHRDTHFQILKALKIGDQLHLEDSSGGLYQYEVTSIEIADSRHHQLWLNTNEEQLTLVTCYPFDAVVAGGPLRYVVMASRIDTPGPMTIPNGA